MNSGIYKIENLITGKFYIGSALDFGTRFANHKYELNKNIHPNKYLQNAWNKYGKNNFEFIIIYPCPPEFLIEFEQRFIDRHWDFGFLYNINRYAGNTLGAKHTEETKKYLSQLKSGVSLNLTYKQEQYRIEQTIKANKKYKSKSWKFINPKNQLITITNLKEYCRLHNLDYRAMQRVYNRDQSYHKGYRLPTV